ncbi:MAG TPA: exonuclease subunit SbcD [Clostridia bacterium]|nr:exonuclease subunit SbcD [Clostridia bacterium]
MRILHTSDWHLGRNLEQISRIGEQREFIDYLCRIVEEQKIELVLIAGDIYDTYNPSAAAEELFYEAVDRLCGNGSRSVVVIAGNHDNPERLCAASPLARRKGIILLGYPGSDAGEYLRTEAGAFSGEKMPSTEIADSGPGWLELCVPGCEHHAVIITIPYPSEARLEELLTLEADEAALQQAYSDRVGAIFRKLEDKYREDTVNLVVAHLFLLGGSASDSERTLQVGGAMTVDPSVFPAKAHYAALGHLHRPQEIKNSPCPVFYAGSPLAYSFSEANYAKAVYIIDAKPGEKAAVTSLYLDCGRPLKRWIADKGIGQALEWCREGLDANAWIDLEIVTDRIFTPEEQKTLRSLNPGIINIRPRIKSEEAGTSGFQSREGRKIDELFSDYYKYRMGTDIPDELMGVFLEIINGESEESDDAIQECAASGESIAEAGNGDVFGDNEAEKECAAAGESIAEAGNGYMSGGNEAEKECAASGDNGRRSDHEA